MSKKDIKLLKEHFTKERPIRVQIITLSDRASAGEYEDKSGRRLKGHLEGYFESNELVYEATGQIMPDDKDTLEKALIDARESGVHAVFTTGGTGVGPRDITPDVILKIADKVIPGIMELVRYKYGADKPCALLSRTVAAVLGSTIVYALPGSTKGVDEYTEEVMKSFDHVLCVLHELEVHE
jgi:molybdenum cofactor synthesis domain-containing protein